MNAGMKMMLVNESRKGGNQRGGNGGNNGGGNRSRYEAGYENRNEMGGGEMENEMRGQSRYESRDQRRYQMRGGDRGEMRGGDRGEMRGGDRGEMRGQMGPENRGGQRGGNRSEYERDEYEPENEGNEMRSRRRRRYDNGRFAPMRGGGREDMYEPDEDDGPQGAYMGYDGGTRSEMNPIGFSAGGQGKVMELHRGGAQHMSRQGEKIDKATAEEWARSMKNEDGTTGPHWSMEQAKQVMAQRGVNNDPLEFWLTMNMIYSDYLKVAKKLGINNIDFYVEMSKAFLDDKDAGEGKLAKYYEYIVK